MLKHGTNELAWGDVPEESRRALAQRGFTHIFGNEHAATRKRLADAGKTQAEQETALAQWTAGKLSAIADGTLGVRVTSTVDPVEREMERLAGAAIRTAAKAKKVELPKGAAFETIVAKYIAKNSDDLRKQAEAALAAKATQAKLAVEMAGDILAGL